MMKAKYAIGQEFYYPIESRDKDRLHRVHDVLTQISALTGDVTFLYICRDFWSDAEFTEEEVTASIEYGIRQ